MLRYVIAMGALLYTYVIRDSLVLTGSSLKFHDSLKSKALTCILFIENRINNKWKQNIKLQKI